MQTSTATATPIPVRSITITRCEGFEEELITRTFAGPQAWHLAAEELRRWARTAPEAGSGYDKCDFAITWEDSSSYEGRYDLQRHSDGELGAQVTRFMEWVSKGKLGAEKAESARSMLATLDLGAW